MDFERPALPDEDCRPVADTFCVERVRRAEERGVVIVNGVECPRCKVRPPRVCRMVIDSK